MRQQGRASLIMERWVTRLPRLGNTFLLPYRLTPCLPAWMSSRWCCTRTASTLTERAKAEEGEEEARRRKDPIGEVAKISSAFVLETFGRNQELARVRGSNTSDVGAAGAVSMFLMMLMLVFCTVGMSMLQI